MPIDGIHQGQCGSKGAKDNLVGNRSLNMDYNGNGAKNSSLVNEVEEHGSSRDAALNIHDSGYHRQNVAEARLPWSNGEARRSGKIIPAEIRAGLSGS